MTESLFKTNTRPIDMNILKATIPIGLGDLLYTKAMLDQAKHRYQEIHLRLHRDIVSFYKLDPNYNQFLDDIGKLFFSEPPYILSSEAIPFYGLVSLCNDNKISPVKPRLNHLMCRGTPLDIDGEYIAIVTKVRYMPRDHFNTKVSEMFQVLRTVSQKYKVVVLGERQVEMNEGYAEFRDGIYSIYNDVINNIPDDRLVDLTVPALGITAPNLAHIQQDCLIMSKAKYVVTIGVGGGFCMATSVANTIGYRIDQDPIADAVFNREYHDAVVTKDWGRFLRKLQGFP